MVALPLAVLAVAVAAAPDARSPTTATIRPLLEPTDNARLVVPDGTAQLVVAEDLSAQWETAMPSPLCTVTAGAVCAFWVRASELAATVTASTFTSL